MTSTDGPRMTDPTDPACDLLAYVAHCLREGSTPAEVRVQLLALGHDDDRVDEAIEAALRPTPPDPASAWVAADAPRRRNMGIGFLLLVVGIGLAFLSVVLRAELPPAVGVGMNYAGWGAVIGGLFFFFIGLAQSPGRP